MTRREVEQQVKAAGAGLLQETRKVFSAVHRKRFIVKKRGDDVLVEVPLTVTLAAALLLPAATAVALVTAIAAGCSVELKDPMKSADGPMRPAPKRTETSAPEAPAPH
jgi:hypothetical protein